MAMTLGVRQPVSVNEAVELIWYILNQVMLCKQVFTLSQLTLRHSYPVVLAGWISLKSMSLQVSFSPAAPLQPAKKQSQLNVR